MDPVHAIEALHEKSQLAMEGQLSVQSTQTPPAGPQEAIPVPGLHIVPSQQLPVHVRPPEQLELQRPVVGLHASPAPQPETVHEMGASLPES
jgi:hypothetical protein